MMEPPNILPSSASNSQGQEASIKIVRDKSRRTNVMRLSHAFPVNSKTWKQVRMERENNYKEFKLDSEDGPKYGMGSEFGRENREEARRKKYGIITKKYNPDNQPWILKFGGKGGKKFKGIREGGVAENVSYYVFKRTGPTQYEARPVSEWYNFTPIQCYKTLSPEEAEEAYGRREKVFNFFSIMTQKRLRADAGAEDEGDESAPGAKRKKKKKQPADFKITDFDELGNDLGSDLSDSDGEEDNEKPKKKNAKKGKKKKKEQDKSDDEALEESDEGDFDDKEVDYITNSSSSEEEIGEDEKTNRDLKGVEDEEALRKLMSEDEEEENAEENKETEENGESKEKTAETKPKQKKKKSDSSGESSSESSDSDYDDPKFKSAIFVATSKKKNGSDNSAGSSRANTPTKLHGDKDSQKGIKRKFGDASPLATKKQKTESQSSHSSSSTLDGINEESVRRYLKRKPMTAVELLHKFKSKKTKMSSQQLVQKIADVLKRMDLQKSNIKGKMYLSVKNT